MNKDVKIALAIIASTIIPGLGNLIYKQYKLGTILALLSLFLTIFYFLPLIPIYDGSKNFPLLIVLSVIATFAFLIDLGLMIYSIAKIWKFTKF